MVESQIKKINDDSQQLTRLKKKVAQEQQHSQVLAESLGRLNAKLHQTREESCTAMQQSRLMHEQNKREFAAKEQYLKEKINIIYQSIDSKEDESEKLQRAAREKLERSNTNPTNNEDEFSTIKTEENASSITIQEKKMREFDAEREKLMKSRQDRRLAITQRYWKEVVELEKGFENELTLLMEKYTPDCLEEETTKYNLKEQDKR